MTKKRKNNSKILYVLLGFLIFFVVFVYLLTRPSTLSIALKELESSYSKDEVKAVWDNYKSELATENDFLYQIRLKLSSICTSKSEMNSCKSWLPKAPESLNIIVIPDLSNRLTTIPNQKQNDIEILNFIWNKFKKLSIPKRQSNDFLSIDLTDNNQLPNFQSIADNLVFDLSKEKKGAESNKRFFDSKGDQFSNNIENLYKMIGTINGADFVAYFKNHAENNLKKSDFFNEYRNVFIILTDGYLETSKPFYAYTGTSNSQGLICNDIKSGLNLNSSFEKQKIAPIASRIPTIIDLSDAEVLILEVNERPGGEKCHYDILKKFWKDWLKEMKVKNAEDDFFLIHEDASKKTINKLDDFLSKKYSYIDDTKGRDTVKVPRPSGLKPLPKPIPIPKEPNCNPQEISNCYKENIQRLSNPSHQISTNIVLLIRGKISNIQSKFIIY